jgi:integrase
MTKRILTDKMLQALKPAKAGQRYEVWDADIHARGLGVRITAKGTKTFILMRRYPGSPNPVRRELGRYGEVSLAQARERAKEWIGLIAVGKDPAHEKERKKIEQSRKRETSFRAVFEAFAKDKLPSERQGKKVEREIRREFLPLWGERHIGDISRLDVQTVVKAIKQRGAPVQARSLLGSVRRVFAWAVDEAVYGIETNPCDGLKPQKLFGDKVSRDRILSPDELLAFLRAVERIPYPVGPVYKLLMLTGLRLNEVFEASWPEFDLKNEIWTIPASRMKGTNSKARPHVVPITADIRALLDELPRFKAGPFLFSANFGAAPIWATNRIKIKLDKRMLLTLQAMARQRGDDPAKVELGNFTNHDLRRTVASGLSALRIPRDVREAVLAHKAPGIAGIYDRHDFFPEKKHALEAWAAKLRSIVEPTTTPDNVVPLKVSR